MASVYYFRRSKPLLLFLVAVLAVHKPSHKFIVHGTKPYCAVNYQTKEVNCVYSTINECRERHKDYDMIVCVPNTYTK
jgi:hypothetical protein